MSLSQAGIEDGTVPQPHTTAGLVVAIVGVFFGNRLGGLVGAIVGLVGGFIIGFLAAVVWFTLMARLEPDAGEVEGDGGGEEAGG